MKATLPRHVSVSPPSRWHLKPARGAKKRDFLSLLDLSAAELAALLDFAAEVKAAPLAFARALDGVTGALVFEKPSLRTRVTFEVGFHQLGAQSIYLAPGDIDLGKRDPASDVVRDLASWVDVLVVRSLGQDVLQETARAAEIPVINALSDLLHPCQTVADLLTLRECKGKLAGLSLAFVGDGNNVAHSLIHGAARTGIHLTLATPHGYEPSPAILEESAAGARATGAKIRVVRDPAEAVRRADAVYTDVWMRIGQVRQAKRRRKDFAGYRVDSRLMSLARPDAVFLHRLPAHRGNEVSAEVLEGPQSITVEQAANRLPVHKAILLALLNGRPSALAGKGRR